MRRESSQRVRLAGTRDRNVQHPAHTKQRLRINTILTAERQRTYIETIRKTGSWALANWDRVVAEPDLQCHYKGPYFWASLGNMEMEGGAMVGRFSLS